MIVACLPSDQSGFSPVVTSRIGSSGAGAGEASVNSAVSLSSVFGLYALLRSSAEKLNGWPASRSVLPRRTLNSLAGRTAPVSSSVTQCAAVKK